MGFWSKVAAVAGVIAAPFTGGASLALTAAAIVAPKLVDKVVDSVIDFVVQPFMGMFGGVDAGASEAERQQGVLVTRRAGGAESIPVIYGLRKVGGLITFAETGSTNNKYLWVAYVFSEGCVEGLYELYVDDVQLPGTVIGQLNNGQTITISEGKFANRVTMRWSPGVYYSTPSSSTLGTDIKNGIFSGSPSYKATSTYNGLATLFVRYEWLEIKTQADSDANPFSGSIPDVSAVILGRRVASLVTSTSESYSYGAAGYTERYSTNPAEILLDYLRNPRYGKGLSNSEIDWASWRTSAAKCNQEVTYTASGIKGPIMTCNYVLTTANTIFDNTKALLSGFRAYMPYVQGKYKLKIEDAGDPTDITSGSAVIIAECVASSQIIDESLLDNRYEIVGDVTYNGIDRSSKYNQVIVTYVDPRTEYKWSNQQVVYPPTEAERLAYVAQDGNREYSTTVTCPTITNYAMAQDFARLIFNKSRYQETASLRVSSHAFELEPGDNIRIQSKMLNFYDTPWRVINITHNNDYTFSLSCVRNPDFIYPYVRAGEVDRVLPIYVPQGVTIYYPKATDTPNISLSPPTRAYVDTNLPSPPATNPTPTVPTTTDGGGVGSPTSPINTSPPNNTPPTAPAQKPLIDIVDFTNVTYVVKNGLTYARLTFAQPDNGMYAGIRMYYKSGGTAYTQADENTIPGAGKTITFDLGPLAISSTVQAQLNVYDVYTRVKYSTGELSSNYTRVQLNPATATAGNPSEIIQTVAQSWPSITLETVGRRDTKIESVTGLISSMPAVGLPRSISFNITQDVRTQTPNYDVVGVNIYYKASASTYYDVVRVKFDNYAPGQTKTIAFTGDIGVSGGPSNYNFRFRLSYNDGTESTYQYEADWPVISVLGVYPVDPSYGASSSIKLASTSPVITVDQAPPGAVASALDTKLGIGSTNAGINDISSGTTYGMRFYFDPPAAANLATWRGTKIRYRPVTPGTNPTLTDTGINRNVKPSAVSGLVMIELWGITFDQKYEIVITPIVYSGGVEVESNYSLFGVGYVHNRQQATDYPSNTNWAPSFSFQQMDTKTALNTAGQAFSATDPTVDIISFDAMLSKKANTGWSNLYLSGTQVERTAYFRLVYNGDKITGLSKLIIYRRNRSTQWGPTGSTGASQGYATHYGVGRWEKIEVTHTGTGNKIVNLRPPTSLYEFDPYYQIPGYGTRNLTQTFVGEAAGAVPVNTEIGGVDFLIIAVVGSTVSAKSQFVISQQVITSITTSAGFVDDLLSPNRPEIITYASHPLIQDSTYTAGFYRRLGDFRTPLSISNYDTYTIKRIGGASATQILAVPSDGPATV